MRFIKKNIKWVTVGMLLIGLFGVFGIKIYLNGQALKKEEVSLGELEVIQDEEQEEIIVSDAIQKVFVDIKGAVVNPGVYEIESDKKVIDVVNIAGGFTENANTTLINLAKQVKNEMVIIIYTNEEVEKAGQENSVVKIIDKECVCPEIQNDACLEQKNTESSVNDTDDGLSMAINLNTATKEELEQLPGIGASKAEAIIQYREEIGSFQSIEELKNVTGIGESLYEKVKDYITV